MGIRTMIKKVGGKTNDKIAKLATLSSEQIDQIQEKRNEYLKELPALNDQVAVSMTEKLLAASSIEIYNAYLPQLKELYLPVEEKTEFDTEFSSYKNIRYFNITRWVTDKNENSLEKLVNVYQVLSDEECNIALVFNRTRRNTEVYLAVTSMKNTGSNTTANNYAERIKEALSGNFPGSEFSGAKKDRIPCLDNEIAYSVAVASNIPTEKSEKFISQTIEKLLDGCVPTKASQEYTLILLATPILDVEERKLHLSKIYSELAPYAAWTTDFHYTEGDSIGSSATAGVNIGVSAGIECAEFGRNIISYDEMNKDSINMGNLLQIGKVFHMYSQEENSVVLLKKSLASHTFITGSTGSGKSNTVYQIISEARCQDVHFLVVEPAKGEYKDVFGTDPDVSVYGTNPKISPMLKINPFSFPEEIHVLEHLDRLVEIFNVCWPMYAAMPAVLKNAVEKSYKDCGWNLLTSENELDKPLYPSFQDVADNVRIIINSSEYDAENKGAYKGSLITRLESLTNGLNGMLFVQDNEISLEDLFDKNVIVDLSRVGSAETKSLIMGMIVLKLQEYRMASSNGINAELNHITILEEAHNLLKRTSTEQSAESSNLLGKSVEMLANAIAEMRTYGEGFIIADQAPGLLDMSVIRNTNTKIIMRLPDQTDRELVGHAANLNDDQIKELAKLPCGVAAVYQNEWIQPVLCKVEHYVTNGRRYTYSPRKSELLKETQNDLTQVLQQIIKSVLKDNLHLKSTKYIEEIVWNSSMKNSAKFKLAKSIKEGPKALCQAVYELLGGSDAIKEISENRFTTDNRWVGDIINSLRNFDQTAYEKSELEKIVLFLFEELERNEPWYKNLHESVEWAYYHKGGLL